MSKRRGFSAQTEVLRPHPDDAHDIVYAKFADGCVPGRAFLKSCPDGVRDKFRAVLIAVAGAPPHKFSGGGYWEAMKGDMRGFHEVRIDGPKRTHYRLFCLIDARAAAAARPYLVILDGRRKPFRTKLKQSDYSAIRELGKEFLSQNPRRLA